MKTLCLIIFLFFSLVFNTAFFSTLKSSNNNTTSTSQIKASTMNTLPDYQHSKENKNIIRFASDRTWVVFDENPLESNHALGYAQPVRLNRYYPAGAPSNAVSYDYEHSGGWGANLENIPGSQWVWCPNVSARDLADLKKYFFTKQINVPSLPIEATIFVAADDFAEITINNQRIGSVGSITNINLAAKAQNGQFFDITQYLVKGTNTITVYAQNGPSHFGGRSTPCNYAQNPAGVVFGGTIILEK